MKLGFVDKEEAKLGPQRIRVKSFRIRLATFLMKSSTELDRWLKTSKELRIYK